LLWWEGLRRLVRRLLYILQADKARLWHGSFRLLSLPLGVESVIEMIDLLLR
jgi:hypothetical protein